MEWSEFQKRAIDDVTEGYRSKAPSDQRLLQVLIIPPFQAVSNAELFLKQGGMLFVAQKIWHREHDFERYQTSNAAFRRLRHFTPTIETYTARVDEDRATPILNLFRTLHIPVWQANEPAPADDTHYQVRLETAATCAQFQWASSAVSLWVQLSDAAAHFVELVKIAIEQKH